VGIDGTPSSRAALRWAAGAARAQQARLTAVHVWDSPIPRDDARSVRLARNAHALLAGVVDDVADELLGLGVEPVTVRGEASQVLLAQAAHASMLVLGRAVGARGAARAAGAARAGDVRRRCVERTACPVVVVPTPATGAASSPTPPATATRRLEAR
jgi:nucleotide-binding universal stress UspA family protein